MDMIRKCFDTRKMMGQLLHRKAMDYFRQYLIVGGMPQAVGEYVSSRDFDRVDAVKRDILTLYRADIAKRAEGYVQKVSSIFDEIPAQLQKHEKKFRLSAIKKEELPRIFEKGFTGTNGRKNDRATGMGLYLCRKLCGKLGIEIDARSEYGNGTCIVLEFPISSYVINEA